QCSVATIGRDALELRAEWANARLAAIEEAMAEELARLAALEAVWWPKAVKAEATATDKVLAIQRQRMALLGWRGGGTRLAVEAGARREGSGGTGSEVVRVT